jgi:phage gpG-like protein
MFFDRAKIKQKVDARTRKVLSKFGAFVRQTSRRSIRKRKRSSRPGHPPSSHIGTLKRFIFFGYDEHHRSVIIGPVIAPGKKGKAPATLEYGGRVALPKKNVKIEARPYMNPAFEKELPKVPGLWADSIK